MLLLIKFAYDPRVVVKVRLVDIWALGLFYTKIILWLPRFEALQHMNEGFKGYALCDASVPNLSQGAQISAPVAAAPARESPRTLHSDSDLYLPKVETGDEVPLCGYQLDTIVQPQSQATFDQPWAAYGQTIPGAASGHLPFQATFPTSSGQSAYPGTTFQSLPTFSFTKDPLSLPNSFDPTTSSVVSSFSGPQFSPNHIQTPPLLEPVPVLGWRPSSFLDIFTPIKTEFSADEPNGDFNTWYQSNNVA